MSRTFQNLRVFPNMSVFDNVSVGSVGAGQSAFAAVRPWRGRLDAISAPEALERVGSPNSRRSWPPTSYGKRKYLEIACALAMRLIS